MEGPLDTGRLALNGRRRPQTRAGKGPAADPGGRTPTRTRKAQRGLAWRRSYPKLRFLFVHIFYGVVGVVVNVVKNKSTIGMKLFFFG